MSKGVLSGDTDMASLPSFFDASTCTRKGLCPIGRKDDPSIVSHSLYYEQHGNGPQRVIFIMGLNATCWAWKDQVERFGRDSEYSVLVFDNRGVGNSDAPIGPYSTSDMAEDSIALLEYLGWTDGRDLHIVGISMGGMIAQELALRIPSRILSLTLAVTRAEAPPWTDHRPLRSLFSIIRIMLLRDPYARIPLALSKPFPEAWLDAKAEGDPRGRTNRQVQAELYVQRISCTRPQTLVGAFSQLWAGSTHYLSHKRLQMLGQAMPKVLVITGDDDALVTPICSERLAEGLRGGAKEAMGGVDGNENMANHIELLIWEKTGHGIHAQWPERFNATLERVFREGTKAAKDGMVS